MAEGTPLARFITAIILAIHIVDYVQCQVLTPPYFNLAVGRSIEASATCGEDVDDAELFCKLTGANPGSEGLQEYNVIQGQLCDHCDRYNVNKSHPADYAIDGTERWWQSPPLSRGLQFNQVNLTMQLGQEFHVAYVFIKMGNSPRPGVFALERSTDNGQTWKPWQFFADTPSDCRQFFGDYEYTDRIVKDDSVVCTTAYSKVVPLEGGEIVVSLVNGRPSANNFSYASTLQEWTKATSVRLRLLRTKTLLGHLMAVARQDPTVTRRYYYSVKDISIGGRCVCNGHADVCDKTDPLDRYRLLCRCRHNTCGPQCNTCCPGFVQKPWKPATIQDANECEPCNCYGHTDQCYYDEDVAARRESIDINGNYEGGGVCQNCQHNTEGINCEKCKFGYYRPHGVPKDAIDACRRCSCDDTFSTGDCEDGTGKCICKPEYAGERCERCNAGYFGWPRCQECECFINGTINGVCEVGGGQCPCKPNFAGYNCKQCAYGYYGFPECKACGCDSIGSSSSYCDGESGQCQCNLNYGGRDCAECAAGYFNYPACQLCNCDPSGCSANICNPDTGRCECEDNFGGARCDRCNTGYYRHPFCIECQCTFPGSQGTDCSADGQCTCNYNFAGPKCDRCAPGYYKYPECLPCGCDTFGAYGVTCNQQTGQCDCKPTFEGIQCDTCKPNYYNYPNCEECNCHPDGAQTIPGYPRGGCGSVHPGTLCECKDKVRGKFCDMCAEGYWNLSPNNQLGCESCDCQRKGTLGSQLACDDESGQCVCRPYAAGRQCETCADGTYNLQDYNAFGCQDCDCDVGGSLDDTCDKDSGACKCRPRVNGRRCDTPLQTHYFPTLYQHRYEMEDGRTPTRGPVRYGFDEGMFPDYSWRGFAIFSRLQDEVLVDVDVQRPSLYRIVFRYVNNGYESITADVTAQPEFGSTDVEQTSTVVFSPTGRVPTFVTVGSGIVSSFVLNPGLWTISLKLPSDMQDRMLVDYLVLLPQDYYEATVLQDPVNRPCMVPATDALCKHFTYVDVATFPSARGESGTDLYGDETQLYPDNKVCQELGTPNMAYLDSMQRQLDLELYIPRSGKYILFLQYHSPSGTRKQQINIELENGQTYDGKLFLPGCPYSSLCRMLVVDDYMDKLVFDLQQGIHRVSLSSNEPGLDVAVDAIVAIPYADWSLNMIKPQLKCVRRDRQCIESTFLFPTGSVRAEVEAGPNEGRVTDDIPPSIIDTSIRVIKLDGRQPSVNVKASVKNPGPYAFVVHYFQPYEVNVQVDVEINVDSVPTRGMFDAEYCPSVSGCRAQIHLTDGPNGNILDLSDLDFLITFNNTAGRNVWLDYIMVIPAVLFRSKVLDELPVDKSAEFISKCGQDQFYIDENTRGFCRDAVYSLTTEYNNGALNCDCDIDGSTGFSCELFGGQCNCKPDVIGRTCSQCRTGYYGFPNCRPCNCPSGLCDPDSGKCVCPPRVTGPNCNVCLPQTFGFDPLIGCEECACDPMGVMSNNMDCDITTGQCSCKANIGGRRCDQCLPGYSYFPRCVPCNCEPKGTIPQVCDQDTAQCMCKDNVVGIGCSQCAAQTFYLEDRNPKGCTKCFCFGTTTTCQSSSLRRSQVRSMRGWGITNLKMPNIDYSENAFEAKIEQDGLVNPDNAIYWIAPEAYLKNKVTSYGGNLIYTVSFHLPPRNRDSSGQVLADVRLEGANMTIVHISPEQPVPDKDLRVVLDMIESKFMHESTGAAVSREQFMMVLSNIQSLAIRANYYSVVSRVRLSEVSLDIATRDGTGSLARNVEQCRCPPNYEGTSCERCAPGYYRQKTGPYLGICVPCECNGKADSCDPDTGVCQNCRENFGGPQCLTCRPGYYTDPYTGSCTICHCPLPFDSNNFADTCELLPNGRFDCQCKMGYTGLQCDTCDYGYWGNPTEIGGECNPCDCSGNIDLSDRQSCDPINGECLKCLDNTAGEKCERCADWYWGDAIDLKNCQPCQCNQIGSELCDLRTGVCMCKPNVVGPTCDKCARGTFGFDSGNGCSVCACADASITADCDVNSGQCQCQAGATGRRCDQCEQGYWNYGPTGCQKCDCESDGATTCDPRTGQCQCLPGVTGPKCDMCLPRWVLVPDEGCHECDSCIHILLDEVEDLDSKVTVIMDDLDSVSVGVGAIRRLEAINNTAHNLRPDVDGLITRPSDPNLLDPLKSELQDLQTETQETRKRADKLMREADLVEADAADTRRDAEGLDDLVKMATDAADDAVRYAQDILDDILSSKEASDLDRMLREAEDMLTELKDRNFDAAEEKAENELDKAVEALNDAKKLFDQAAEQANRTRDLGISVTDIKDKLNDLMNNSRHALDNAQAANDLNIRNQKLLDKLRNTVADINDGKSNAEMTIQMTRDALDTARQYLEDARQAYIDAEQELSRLDPATADLRDFVNDLSTSNLELRPLVDNATEHALKLRKQAEFLDSMIADTRESAEGALNASQAYISIVDAINRAYDASLEATDDAEKALDLSNGLAAEAEQSKQRSTDLKATADETMATVTDELDPRLQDAIKLTDDVENLNQRIRDELNYINTELDQLPEDGYGAEAQAALDKAADAQVRADVARDKIRQIQDALPEDQRRIDQIPYDIEEANHNVDRAQASVDNVLKLVPDTVALLDKLQVRAEQVNQVGEDLTRDIEVLKENIGLARGEASRIRVGMQFLPESSLMLRNPPNMANAGSYSKLSLYFKTNQENGFLAYVGPDASSFGQLQTDDYMALEIIEGFVNFKFNLGTGVGVIVNNKNVADDQWHEVIAERNGRTATVTVRTEDETDSVASGTAEGGHSVLDIDPRFSKFYVGGVRDGAGLEGKVENTRFQGCIEDVKFDDSPIGLWDFVYGENNKQGCEARAGLEVAQPNGFRFNGDGYVVMEKEWYNPSKDATVSLKFRTFAENGLLFLMGDDQNSYLSIELKDGRILYQFDLGSGAAQLFTREFDDNGRKLKFNDGEWHQLETRRIDRNGKVTVDGVDLATGKSPGLQKKLTINNYIHVGGYKGEHKYADVTSIPFLGCIKDLQLGGNIRDMNDNMYAYGVTPGCAETARVVSFAEGGGGESYLAMPSVNVDANFQMTFKVKSENEDGLIFYVSDDQQSQQNAMSVSLSEGKIVMVSTVQGEQTKLESTGEKYNDGRWHYITVTKQGRTLQLDIDDREMISGSYDGKRRMDTTSYLYFGGLPFRPADNNAAAIVNYYGCIGDVTVNGNFLNFAAGDPNQRLGASLASCPITYTYDRIDMGDFTLPPLPVRPSPPTGEVDDTQCVLPLRPQIAAADPNSGTMFGSTPDSRWEYDTFPDTFRSRSEFSLDFKSTNPNGVMFYVADARQKDFISVYLRGGKVVYGFNCGNDAVFIESTETYNDGQWHTVEFQRVRKDGTLIVDGIDTNTGSTGGRSQSINVETPFYVGGMPQDQFALAQTNIEGLTNGLVGCIRNPALKDQPFGEPARAFDVQSCSDNIEPGTFFGANGGYAQLAQNLNVDLDLDIELDVRPRTKDGVLLSIIGDTGDYLVLQMVRGELLFSMDNGAGEVVTSYTPPTQSTLCNGQWHKIRGQKAKNVITLEVDGVFTKPGVGEAGVSKTDTNDPLYVGGVPVRHRGIKTTLQFVGCIRNLKLTDTPVDMATLITDGDVTRGSCPTN